MNKLIEQLETLPSFSGLKKAISEKLTINNFYVKNFEPSKTFTVENAVYELSDDQVECGAIDALLSDNTGYFDEFVNEELRADVTEFIRSIIKEVINVK